MTASTIARKAAPKNAVSNAVAKNTNSARSNRIATRAETFTAKATASVERWLSLKAAQASLPFSATNAERDKAASRLAFAQDDAITAIRRMAWVDSGYQPDDDDLASLTPVASFVHEGLRRVFVATTGEYLGDSVPVGWQTPEYETIIQSPFCGA